MATKKTAKDADAGFQDDAGKIADDAPELPYLLGTWHGLTQYRCRECPFDALEEETIIEHSAAHWVEEQAQDLQAARESQAPPGRGLIAVADKNGNPR